MVAHLPRRVHRVLRHRQLRLHQCVRAHDVWVTDLHHVRIDDRAGLKK